MGCLVLQPSTTGGNRSYPYFLAETDGPRYPGYKISIVASQPSVERVAGAIHSMGGRIGTHMLLRVPPRDSVVRQ
jgi:hypothetical protein